MQDLIPLMIEFQTYKFSFKFVETVLEMTKSKNYILWLASCIPKFSLDKVIKKTLKLGLRWPTNIFYVPPQYFFQLKCKLHTKN